MYVRMWYVCQYVHKQRTTTNIVELPCNYSIPVLMLKMELEVLQKMDWEELWIPMWKETLIDCSIH